MHKKSKTPKNLLDYSPFLAISLSCMVLGNIIDDGKLIPKIVSIGVRDVKIIFTPMTVNQNLG